MSKYAVQRPGHASEIQRFDEQACVSDLPAAAAAHEPPKLRLNGSSLPRRLFLEGAEGSKVTLRADDVLHQGGTESADQLVLQVRDAHVETAPFHFRAIEVGAETGPLESTLEVALLSLVAKAGKSHVRPMRAEPIQEASDVVRTPHRYDRNALSIELPITTRS
jgi:hypothetical protein